MRLRATKSAHSVSYSVIKSAYINKKRTTVTVEKLGNEKEICKKHGVSDALAWAKEYVANLNHNHPSNGWFARGYKPLLLGQRLKALAFILGYGKFAFAYFPQPHSSHIAFDSSLPHKGVWLLLHFNP